MGKLLRLFLVVAVGVVAGLSATDVAALPIFTASGTAGDGRPMNATAEFLNITASGFDVKLTNTGGPGQVGGISSVLDGLIIVLSATPSGGGLTGATSANGSVNCVGGTCVFTAGPIVDNTTFFGWTYKPATGELEAGNGSLKPNGIVNSNIQTTDGIPNHQHNPYLNGPVTFHVNLLGLATAPTVERVTFEFGTRPDTVVVNRDDPPIPPTSVPEPGTLALVGTAAVAGGAALRGLRKK